MTHPLSLTINGESYTLLVEPYCSLLDMLRDQLQLTGTKKGCDEGDCGACTVLMDGKTVTSCMVLALDARDKEITTVEGLRQGNTLHPVQAAFVQYGGVQCGFCTPGLIMSGVGLLLENPSPPRKRCVLPLAAICAAAPATRKWCRPSSRRLKPCKRKRLNEEKHDA